MFCVGLKNSPLFKSIAFISLETEFCTLLAAFFIVGTISCVSTPTNSDTINPNFKKGLESSMLLVPADLKAINSLSAFSLFVRYIADINPDTGKIAKIIFGSESKVKFIKIPIDFPSPRSKSKVLTDLLLQYINDKTNVKKQKMLINL